jgi:hypothetical protein
MKHQIVAKMWYGLVAYCTSFVAHNDFPLSAVVVTTW